MIHTLFIIDKNGDIIIERHYRGLVSRSVGEKFWEEVKKTNGKPENTPPVICTPKYYLIHVYKNDMFFVGVVQSETPPLMVTQLLYKIVDIFERYIGKISDFNIKQNFVTIYQLLDEMVDNGFPITTELSLLQDLVKPPTNMIQGLANAVQQPSSGHGRSPVPWRKLGIRYTNNEIFFDIIEELNCVVDVNGMVATGEVYGRIAANCRLSGMPDLMMTFKDPSLIDDCAFHPCVRYAKFDQDRSVSFVPPDGEFELLNYRISNFTALPLYCRPQITFFEGGANLNIMCGLKPTHNKVLEDVRVIIPLPAPILGNVDVTVSQGSLILDNAKRVLRWEIGKLVPQSKTTPSASGKLSFNGKMEGINGTACVLVSFKIPQGSLSEVKVDSVQLKAEKYKPYKGVRYMSSAGRVEVRNV